jgi:O-antigen ligase
VAQLDLTPTGSASIGRAIDAGLLVRSILIAAVFLLLWISLRPFQSLADPPEVTETGNLINQISYSLLFVLLAAWCLMHQPSRLLLLVRPVLAASLLWFALSVVTSWDPALAVRRFAFTLVTLGIAAMVMLVPKNIRHFSDVMAGIALTVLVLSYLGALLAPEVSVHQATDFLEPDLAGNWRGVFPHKNEAGATMASLVFVGLFVARGRSFFLGAMIAAPALIFLFFTQSKTSMAMLPLVLIISTIMSWIRRPVVGIAIALSGLAGFSILSVGSAYSEAIRAVVDTVLTDTTFTGRTDVWQFAVEHLTERPITGYGFSAFWGTPAVVYGMGGTSSWAHMAGHAHNGYLDVALGVGIPGAALAILWLVVLPLVDFYRSPRQSAAAPLEMLFLRVCLFIAYASCFESLLLQEGSGALLLFAATFGLRLLSVSRPTP